MPRIGAGKAPKMVKRAAAVSKPKSTEAPAKPSGVKSVAPAARANASAPALNVIDPSNAIATLNLLNGAPPRPGT
jgi:hypothetical protein